MNFVLFNFFYVEYKIKQFCNNWNYHSDIYVYLHKVEFSCCQIFNGWLLVQYYLVMLIY